jgi:hypothetical protein
MTLLCRGGGARTCAMPSRALRNAQKKGDARVSASEPYTRSHSPARRAGLGMGRRCVAGCRWEWELGGASDAAGAVLTVQPRVGSRGGVRKHASLKYPNALLDPRALCRGRCPAPPWNVLSWH